MHVKKLLNEYLFSDITTPPTPPVPAKPPPSTSRWSKAPPNQPPERTERIKTELEKLNEQIARERQEIESISVAISRNSDLTRSGGIPGLDGEFDESFGENEQNNFPDLQTDNQNNSSSQEIEEMEVTEVEIEKEVRKEEILKTEEEPAQMEIPQQIELITQIDLPQEFELPPESTKSPEVMELEQGDGDNEAEPFPPGEEFLTPKRKVEELTDDKLGFTSTSSKLQKKKIEINIKSSWSAIAGTQAAGNSETPPVSEPSEKVKIPSLQEIPLPPSSSETNWPPQFNVPPPSFVRK